jgi:hypothetical protein
MVALLSWVGAPAQAQPCAHDLCEQGVPLNAACDPCVADICQGDSFCCEFDWDNSCVEMVLSVCGDPMCAAACEHSPCESGGPLDADCQPCVTSICAEDPSCCSTQWDSGCIAQVETVCDTQCLDGSDHCQDAVPIEANVPVISSLEGMNSNGCSSVGDSCQSADMWYSYTKSGLQYTELISTCSTQRAFGIDTVISVHSSCPGQPSSEVAANDDFAFGSYPVACNAYADPKLLDSALAFSLNEIPAGETAIIRVSHYGGSPEGPFVLRLLPEPSTTVLGVAGVAWLLVLHRFRIHRQGRNPRRS